MAAAAMLLLSTGASALGLGRVNVQSVLGETLRAEIEVTSLNAEEASSLRVSLASPDAFKSSGVEYNPVLAGAQITLARRSDGRPVLVLASDKVVQEPFVDVIVEFQWSTGRLTRSYTLLIDPPGRNAAAQPGTAPVAPVFSPAPPPRAAAPAPAPQVATTLPPAAAPAPRPAAPVPAPAPAPVARAPRPAPRPAPAPSPVEAPAPSPATASSGDTVRVRQGDTLTSIASANSKAGVSLDQMLVSLYRNNPQAFVDENMNRMKAGVTLAVPSAETAKQLSTEEAHKVIQAQSVDFAAYRQRLASGVSTVRTDEGKRQASGKVEAQVRDQKAAATPAPDKLTLSRGSVKSAASSSEAKVSKDTQRAAEAARVAELSRNLSELKKLSAGTPPAPAAPAAAASKPATPVPTIVVPPVLHAAPPASAPAPAPAVVASKPAPAPAPAVIPSAPSVVASAATPAVLPPASAPAASASAVVATAPLAASAALPPVASAPARGASGPVAAPPAADTDSFLSSLTESPYIIPGLAAIVVALGGFAFWRKRQGANKFSGETSFIESKIQPDSFFGASGGQRVDTRDGASSSAASSSLNYSLSQLDAIGDVDPVAEADVYLAYGRDLQAEEILKEAMRSTPDRLAIRTKLLEVYAKRADLKTFETQARQLHGLTGGQGEDWVKAQDLGRQIDPTNPLYHEGADFNAGDTEPVPLTGVPNDDADATLIRPPAMQHEPPRNEFHSTDLPIDFDIEHSGTEPRAFTTTERQRVEPLAAPADETPFEVSDFDLDATPVEAPAPTPPASVPAPPRTEEVPASVMPPSIDFDFGDLSLDLDTPAGGAATHVAAAAPESVMPELDLPPLGESEPMARKIELADEFRRIGDHEGARELLEEVVAKADGTLKSRAQAMLDSLG